MKKPHVSFPVFLLVVLGITLLTLQGCRHHPTAKYSPPPPERKVMQYDFESLAEAEKTIAELKTRIRGLDKYETQQRSLGAINDVRNTNTFGAVKLDGEPTYEELANLHYGQAAATEKEIVHLKKDLASAQQAKAKLQKQSQGCFLPDTLVETADGLFKPFAKLQVGDKVMTYDIGYEQKVAKPVVSLYSVDSNHLYTINNELKTTGGERLLSQEGWKEVNNLKKGDVVHIDGKMIEISAIAYQRIDRTLHNIQVADTHNFYVSTPGGFKYLVHNTGGGGSGGGSK